MSVLEVVIACVTSNTRIILKLMTLYRAMHLVQRAVFRSHGIRLSVCLSVCNVGGSGSHRLEILETNCTDN